MATSNGSSGRTDGRSTPARGSPRSNVSRKQISHSSTGDDVEMGRGAKSTDANDDKKTKKTRKIIVIASTMVILLALIIGLSVGLTHRKQNQSNNPSAPSDFSTLGEGTGVGSLSTPTMYSAPTTDLKDGLLPWTIQSFGTNVIEGYEGCDALRADLAEAAAYLANVIIRRNRQYGISYGGGFAVEGDWDGADAVASEMTGEAAPESAKEPAREFAADEADDAADDGGAEDETDYGTNNQVEGVDEADMVKSDGTFIYAAYGDKVVQFDTFGRKVSETTMPAPSFDEDSCDGPYYDEIKTIAEVDELVDFDGGSRRRKLSELKSKKVQGLLQNSANTWKRRRQLRHRRRKVSSIADWGCWRPEARIESMLLENGRLAVVVSGYSNNYRYNPTTQSQQPILGNVGTTKVRVYDTNSLIPNDIDVDSTEQDAKHPSQMKLVASRDLPGYYAPKGGRSIGNRAYLISNNYVDTWHHFDRHFDRWQVIYDGLSDEEYVETATSYAKEKVIPNFTNRLLLELMERADEDLLGTCSHVQQLALYQTGDIDAAANRWWDAGVFSGLSQITSFDLDQIPRSQASAEGEPVLQVEKSVAFVPSSWSTTVYATQNHLFLASQGYDEHPKSRSGFIPTTYILGFDLGGDGPAKGATVGKVPGTVLNQFSIDMYEGHLRVATTTRSDWVCPIEPLVEELDEVSDNAEKEAESTILPVDPIDGEDIFCRDDRVRGPQNQITILEVREGSDVMKQKGQLGGLGKPGESIYAVRYIGWKAFVVTFLRIDPFYTIDLSQPTDPKVVGELEIPGFSNYIHPTEDENVLIAVGENADERGRTLGVQVSLFGVEDFANPELLARYDVENREDQYSYTDVAWDHHAFRYLRQSKQVILPAEVHGRYGEDSFDGFYILDINKNTSNKDERITLRHRVNLAPEKEDMWSHCYSSARLAPRSMVFSGDALLMKNHAVESHRLDQPSGSNTFLWRLEMEDPVPVDESDKRRGCSYWW